MQTVRKGGVRTVKLHAPERRKLEDAALTLRQIAVAISNVEDREHANNIAKALDDIVDDYTPNVEEAEAEKAEAQPPFPVAEVPVAEHKPKERKKEPASA